jgi:hypothetical protein
MTVIGGSRLRLPVPNQARLGGSAWDVEVVSSGSTAYRRRSSGLAKLWHWAAIRPSRRITPWMLQMTGSARRTNGRLLR